MTAATTLAIAEATSVALYEMHFNRLLQQHVSIDDDDKGLDSARDGLVFELGPTVRRFVPHMLAHAQRVLLKHRARRTALLQAYMNVVLEQIMGEITASDAFGFGLFRKVDFVGFGNPRIAKVAALLKFRESATARAGS